MFSKRRVKKGMVSNMNISGVKTICSFFPAIAPSESTCSEMI